MNSTNPSETVGQYARRVSAADTWDQEPTCQGQVGSEEIKYPDLTVELTGGDGNAFALIGNVARAIRRHAGTQAASDFTNQAMEQESYDELLRFIQETVNVA